MKIIYSKTVKNIDILKSEKIVGTNSETTNTCKFLMTTMQSFNWQTLLNTNEFERQLISIAVFKSVRQVFHRK